MSNTITMTQLGWQPFFQQQISLEEWEQVIPARIIEQHKSSLELQHEHGSLSLPLKKSFPALVVGDWILLDHQLQFARLLDRKTCFSRKSAGTQLTTQLISANVDTAFIVCSMNEDFNLNRIERYLALIDESGAMAVVVLTKADLCLHIEDIMKQTRQLSSDLSVETVNALDFQSVGKLKHWVQKGSTLSVLGSSGVGKSTLINSLNEQSTQSTGEIRASDGKGKHTTTCRSLLPLADFAMILDTPGMRELQLVDCNSGISGAFSDIESLAEACRFSDCLHQSEPGCAVAQAVENEELSARRLNNFRKLTRENALNSASIAERRANDKSLTKMYKSHQSKKSRDN